jgi:hypothetical protein
VLYRSDNGKLERLKIEYGTRAYYPRLLDSLDQARMDVINDNSPPRWMADYLARCWSSGRNVISERQRSADQLAFRNSPRKIFGH